MSSLTIDMLGEICPVPLLKTQEAFTLLPPGGTLVVETDFARSVRNITQWCARSGLTYTVKDVAEGVWQIAITKVR